MTIAETVSSYARAHGLDPAGMISVIDADPLPPDPVGYGAGLIRDARGNTWSDPIYPTDYLDLVAESIRESSREPVVW